MKLIKHFLLSLIMRYRQNRMKKMLHTAIFVLKEMESVMIKRGYPHQYRQEIWKNFTENRKEAIEYFKYLLILKLGDKSKGKTNHENNPHNFHNTSADLQRPSADVFSKIFKTICRRRSKDYSGAHK